MVDIIDPVFLTRSQITPFPFGAGPNPVEAVGGQPFTQARGQLEILVDNVAQAYRFRFTVRGGLGRLPGSPNDFFYYVANTAFDDLNNALTVSDSASPNTITITTDAAADAGGRVYAFRFFPYPSVFSTIEKTAGVALAGDLNVTVSWCALAPG